MRNLMNDEATLAHIPITVNWLKFMWYKHSDRERYHMFGSDFGHLCDQMWVIKVFELKTYLASSGNESLSFTPANLKNYHKPISNIPQIWLKSFKPTRLRQRYDFLTREVAKHATWSDQYCLSQSKSCHYGCLNIQVTQLYKIWHFICPLSYNDFLHIFNAFVAIYKI